MSTTSSASIERELTLRSIKEDFPILRVTPKGKRLVYLDNAATSQKPQHVLDVVDTYWTEQNANVHRGVHYLSQLATREFDGAREKVRRFLNARSLNEVIFTKGCTESINLVARSWGKTNIKPGDEILMSTMEHHSNIVPWQMIAEEVGAHVRVIPITDRGEIDLEAYEQLLANGRVRLVALVHVSNALGTINPVKQMIASAHRAGAVVMLDSAQAGPHLRIDVQDLDADFVSLSCHKIYAPTGVGALYGRESLLDAMPPYQGGGDMIRTVSFEKTTYAELPAKFEAGTPNIAGVIGLGAAIDYLAGLAARIKGSEVGRLEDDLDSAFAWIGEWESELGQAATERLLQIPGVRITGTAPKKTGIVSFVMDCAHAHDIGTVLDSEGVAIRAGHHCCMPLMKRLGVAATTRASFAFYNTYEDVDALISGVVKVREMFS